jgi:Flp pilus assembly protein TadG
MSDSKHVSVSEALRRLRRCRSGATLVEFSLVALPLLLLILATFELGFIYWANHELENATSDAARMVRTGQVQAGNLNQSQLKTELCNRTALLVGCLSRVRLDIRSAATFNAISPPQPVDGAGALKPDDAFSYAPGAGDDVVLVSAFYSWSTLFSGTYLVRAAMPVRNEPF